MRKLKRETLTAPEHSKAFVRHYKNQLNIRKPIKIVASGIIQSPAVIGFLNPVILIPVQLLTGTSSEYLKAIIAHEIAHIYRYDFLVNIIQSITTNLFYYHPCAWWINNEINEAREQSCDDIAIQLCEDALLYSKALLRVSEMQTSKLAFAQHFNQNKKHLLNRIQRLFNKSNTRTNTMEKLIAVSLIAGTLLSFAFVIHQPNKQQKNTAVDDRGVVLQSKDKTLNTNEYGLLKFKYGSITCIGKDFEYELEVKDEAFYYEGEVISLQPNRIVTLATKDGPQQLHIKNDTIKFVNAESMSACWSDIRPTYQANQSEDFNSIIDEISDEMNQLKNNQQAETNTQKIDRLANTLLGKIKNIMMEDYKNVNLTLIGNDFEYDIEVKKGIYYFNNEAIPLQPDRKVTIDTKNGPQELIIQNDSIYFSNALAIKYDWGGEYYKVKQINRGKPSKIINDVPEQKQKPNYAPIFSTEDLSIDEAYKMVFEKLVQESLTKYGSIKPNEKFSFKFTNKSSHLNGNALENVKHSEIVELYKAAYQTNTVGNNTYIEITTD